MTAIAAAFRVAAETIDPTPITAWALLVVAVFTIIGGVVAAIALLWRTVALPQIKALIEARVDEFETETRDSLRTIHARIDAYLAHGRSTT